jgi:hypothetical protein
MTSFSFSAATLKICPDFPFPTDLPNRSFLFLSFLNLFLTTLLFPFQLLPPKHLFLFAIITILFKTGLGFGGH